MLNDANSRHALADHCGDFRVVEFLNEAKHDDLALLVAQTQDGIAYAALIACLLQRLLRIAAPLLVYEAVVEFAVISLGAQEGDRQVVGDAQEPGHERSSALLVAVDGPPRLEEALSREILGFASVIHEVVDVAIDADDVAVVKISKGFLIALDCAEDETPFFCSVGLSLLRRL